MASDPPPQSQQSQRVSRRHSGRWGRKKHKQERMMRTKPPHSRPDTPNPSSPNGPVNSSPNTEPLRVPPCPPLLNSPELQLRFLNPADLPEVKRLCREWFPIEYPDTWYADITSNHKFYSVAAVYRGQIVGLVVAEIKEADVLPKEDHEILAATFGRGYRIGYILSLGVIKELRKQGIASFLLENLIAHLTSPDNYDVKGLYLHVLTTNTAAITFYEHRGFRPHLFLPYYYAIGGRRRDGFTYVLYLNGGHPPWSLIDYMLHCCQVCICTLNPWSVTRLVLRKVNLAWFNAMPRIRQIAHGSTAVFS